MGEMALEAMYNGIEEMNKNYEISGGKTYCIGNPKYDRDYWRDVIGVVRKVNDMDIMHIALVTKFLEINKNNGRFYRERLNVFRNQLRIKGFQKQDWNLNIVGVAMGLYCFYPNEADNKLEQYYYDLLSPYMINGKFTGYSCPEI